MDSVLERVRYLPLGQSMQLALLARVWKVPSLHATQTTLPGSSEIFPIGHCAHVRLRLGSLA